MMKTFLASLCIFMLSSVLGFFTQGTVVITAPIEGQRINGNFEVKGSVSSDDFDYAELLYSYDNVESETWFAIEVISQPVKDDVLANWDTTTISDGDYRLKLVLHEKSGNIEEYSVNHLFVRNYTTVTSIPTIASESEFVPTEQIPLESSKSSATPYPANQAAVSVENFLANLKTGAIIGFVFLLIIGMIAYIRGKVSGR